MFRASLVAQMIQKMCMHAKLLQLCPKAPMTVPTVPRLRNKGKHVE